MSDAIKQRKEQSKKQSNWARSGRMARTLGIAVVCSGLLTLNAQANDGSYQYAVDYADAVDYVDTEYTDSDSDNAEGYLQPATYRRGSSRRFSSRGFRGSRGFSRRGFSNRRFRRSSRFNSSRRYRYGNRYYRGGYRSFRRSY